jgi:plasmid maintenance system antidote protein VapI
MTDLYSSDCYKKWVNDKIHAMPKRGRGQYRILADFLHTSPTIITQVFRGDRELTAEQATLLCKYFGLTKMETRYLILLVNLARASSHHYRTLLHEELIEIRSHAKQVGQRVPRHIELTEDAKAILYSNWYYLAAWSLVAIGGFDSAKAVSERLKIPIKKASDALGFLKKHGLVIEKNGKLLVGPTHLHLDSDSPQIPRHHQNWRLRAFQKYESSNDDHVFYTAPVTLSRKDANILREKCLKFIEEAVAVVTPSPSETLHCLCLDWFEV